MRIQNLKGRIVSLLAFALAASAYAQSVPSLINYQGRLTDQNGNPLSAGVYGIQFRIWNSATTTNGSTDLIWGQQQNATIQSSGVFNVILGASGGSPIAGATPAVNNLAYAFAGSNCFLGVTIAVSNGTSIASPSEIVPRQQLLSVPFSIQSQQAQQAQIASSLVTNLADALCPAGSIMAFAGTNVPSGWLVCDGSALSRTNYVNLFNSIGTAWGPGDGFTTFNLPDLRGIFLRGVNGSRSDPFADPDDNTSYRSSIFTGGNAGNSVGSYQQDMFKSHTHTTTWQYMANTGGGYSAQGGGGAFAWGIDLENAVNAAGGDETRPKNAYVYYLIKY